MARWEIAAKSGSFTRGTKNGYIGWTRHHPTIHVTKTGPDSKTSLVQIGGKPGDYQVLAQTVSHSIFATPGTQGKILFKKVVIKSTIESAKSTAERFKRTLAARYDSVTGMTIRRR